MSSETKPKRVYKCGKCGDKGHNARTCKQSKKADVTAVVTETVASTESTPAATTEAVTPSTTEDSSSDDEPAKPQPELPRVVMSQTQDLTAIPDKGPSPVSNVSPYKCEVCYQVGILTLLELENGQSVLRCEHCMNKVRAVKHLKWGATPADKPK